MVIKGMCITESVCCTEGKGSVIMYEQLYKRCQQYNATLLQHAAKERGRYEEEYGYTKEAALVSFI